VSLDRPSTPLARVFASLALAATAAGALAAAPGASSEARRPGPGGLSGARTDIAARLLAAGPRAEGSAAEAAAFSLIEGELRAAGLAPASSGFDDAREGYSTSLIVEARVAGASEEEMAIAVPVGSWVDSRDPAEGLYGIEMALAEARRRAADAAAGRPCPLSLRFVFLGAERRGLRSGGETAALGTRTWIARQSGRGGLAVVYLDVDFPPAGISMRNAGKGVLSPYWLYETARLSLAGSGIAYDLDSNRTQAYRLGLAHDFGPAGPFLEAGIPAIELRGYGGGSATAAGMLGGSSRDWLGAFIDRFAKENAAGFPDTWDRHYFVMQAGKLSVTLRERSYVVFMVVFVALVAASFLAASVTWRRSAKRALERFPSTVLRLVALFAALAAVVVLGKVLSGFEAAVLGSPSGWKLAPRLFVSARVLSSFLFYLAAISILVETRILTPNPRFYEFAALACLAVDALAFSSFDLSASFYFMWGLLFVELSLAVRGRWATVAAYALMYLPLGIVAGELAARPDLEAYARVITPSVLDALTYVALAFPFFVFTASPLLLFERPGRIGRRRAALALATAAIVVEAAALGWAWLFLPSSGPARSDLVATQLADQDARSYELKLTGLRRLGEGRIERGGIGLDYRASGDSARLVGSDGARRISISSQASPFLDREDLEVLVSFDREPYEAALELRAEREMSIYDCSLPFKASVDGRSAVVYAPVNPGSSLSFTLTVPADFGCELVATARYLESPAPLAQSSGSPLADGGFSVLARAYLGHANPAKGPPGGPGG
jgi:hypothetical protein